MKKIIYLIPVFLLCSSIQIFGQVSIGSENDPHPGAVLDLQSTDKGLLLPRVSLTDAATFLVNTSTAEKESAAGMLVFNDGKATPNHLLAGLYVWAGHQWEAISVTANIVANLSDNPHEAANPEVLGSE
jgi:hypothetical protein